MPFSSGAVEEKPKKPEEKKKKSLLSFDVEEEEGADAVSVPKRPKLKKDPDTDTSFLPDKYARLDGWLALWRPYVLFVLCLHRAFTR